MRKIVAKPRLPVVSLSVAAICLLLVCIAWKLPLRNWRDLNVSIRGESVAMQIALAKDLDLDSMRGKDLYLTRLTTVELQSTSLPDAKGANAWLTARGASIVLKALTLAAPGRVELRGGPRLLLGAYSPWVAGQIVASGGTTVEVGQESDAAAYRYRIPDTSAEEISFRGEARQRVPFRLELGPAPAWFWSNVPISELHFLDDQPQPDGTSISGSGIRQATVRLLDVDREVSLQAGDALRLDLTHVNRFWIRRGADPQRFEFNLEARAKGVYAGPFGAETDLSPSLLESLYKQKSLSLFWGSVAFLFSLFVSLRKTWKGELP